MNDKLINFSAVMLVGSLFMSSGCSALFYKESADKYQESTQFMQYVESVFKLQNSVTSDLMSLQDSDDVPNKEAILKAEQSMQEACKTLNEYGARESDKDVADYRKHDNNSGSVWLFFARQRFEKSVKGCEQAANNVRLQLKN